ncbi:MAG: hypothetical protein A3K67_04060 [Euryarchaeota archaeon RBG_16_62_10]|nr:MAG: hypothetical protein A3K67_04060 [Euryarchaeota archaeon RBG_16_62_10]
MSCGRAIAWDANVCPFCGKDYRVAAKAAPKQTLMPTIGGILILLSGIFEIVAGGLLATESTALMPVTFGLSGLFVVCGIVVAILGVIAVVGGYYAIQRKNFNLALVGGIFSLLGLYIIVPLIGLILVLVSKDEFED